MKEIIIAFDIDGTLFGSPLAHKIEPCLNVNIYMLMVLLSKMKNTKIVVWSGGGKEYAETIGNKLGLNKYVDVYEGKQTYDEGINGHIDIAFDDQHEFSLADKNIIVRIN